MLNQSDIADNLSLYAKLMDIHQENSFKVKTYSNAAFQLDRFDGDISNLSLKEIASIRGIGDSIAQKIVEMQRTGEFAELNDLLQKTPPGILEMMRIKGIGPKKISTIWHELEIEDPGELLYACYENRLIKYKGFGAKLQQSIIEAIEFFQSNQSKHLYSQLLPYASEINSTLKDLFGKEGFACVGEFARQYDVIERLEYVLAGDAEDILNTLSAEQAFVFIQEEDNILRFHYREQITLDIICCEHQSLTETVFLHLNSPEFNDAFLDLYPDVILEGETPNDESIFEHVGIPYILPCLRDLPDVLHTPPPHHLIHLKDIKGIIHNHSTWSDGAASIKQMAQECIRLGFEYLVMSDHSVTSFYAGGLTEQQVFEQQEEIDRLNEELKPFKIFKSIECDILGDGRLDYNDKILSTFDLVIASVHQNLKMTEEKAMERVMRAIENPFTTILGHPSGRLLLSRKGYPLRYEEVFAHCAKNKVVVEINANPRRLDLDWSIIPLAKKHQVMLSINPDAHSLTGIQDVYFGVTSSQKGGLSAIDNLSSLSLSEFEQYLRQRKPH